MTYTDELTEQQKTYFLAYLTNTGEDLRMSQKKILQFVNTTIFH